MQSRPPLLSLSTREHSPTCQKIGRKILFRKKPTFLTWNWSTCTHVSSFISNVGFLESDWGVESFSAVLWGQVLLGKTWWLISDWGSFSNGIIASRGGKGRPGAVRKATDFLQPLAIEIFPPILFPPFALLTPFVLVVTFTLCNFLSVVILQAPVTCVQSWLALFSHPKSIVWIKY